MNGSRLSIEIIFTLYIFFNFGCSVNACSLIVKLKLFAKFLHAIPYEHYTHKIAHTKIGNLLARKD